MATKKGLAGTSDFAALATKGHQQMLKLENGFAFMNWSPFDPRKGAGASVQCEWYPTLWGDTRKVLQAWIATIPWDYTGRAYFLNEPDLPAVANEQGFAESAGMTPKAAASLFFWVMQFWPNITWIGPNISQRDCLVTGADGKYCPWLRAFLAELWEWRSYAVSNPYKELGPPFPNWIRMSFHLYPKWPEDIPLEMTGVDWYVDQILLALRESGLESAEREKLWVTETNSRPAAWGPDFPRPAGKPEDWYPANRADWPGVKRWRKWCAEYEAHPNVEKWLGFIGTDPHKPHYALINQSGQLTENGRVFAEV